MVLGKILESPLDHKEIKPVNSEGNQPWTVIGRTEAEAQTLWPCDSKGLLIGKDCDARKDWGQEKGAAEDEMVRQNHQHMNVRKLQEIVKDTGASGAAVYGVTKSQTWLSVWTTANNDFTN